MKPAVKKQPREYDKWREFQNTHMGESLVELTVNTLHPNISEWSGDAVNPDGTLKDASEIKWVNSPSELTPPPLEKRVLEIADSDDHPHLPKRQRVSYLFHFHPRT